MWRVHNYNSNISPALPLPEVEITAPTVIAGSKLTLECSVTPAPYLTAIPVLQVELSGPGDVVLATGTNLTLTHTLDPVFVLSAGQQYVCKTELEIESLGVLQSSQSTYTITVQSKSIATQHCAILAC